MTAVGELIQVDVLFADIDGLLAVELLRHDEEVFFRTLFFLLLSDEGYVFAPANTLCGPGLTAEFVEVLIA